MSIKEPVVAVIIANRNYENWLIGSYLSASIQETRPHIVVADDGSTDNSVERLNDHILDCYHPDYGYITDKVLELDNNLDISKREGKGPSFARNRAIEYAIKHWNPDLFAILDADDEFLPGRVSLCVDLWKTDPDVGAIYTDYYILDERTGQKKLEFKEPFSYSRLLEENIVHSACVISAKVLRDVGYYDESLRTCEDYDLWLRIGKKYPILHIPQPTMIVRTTGLNSTFTVPSEIWLKNLQTIRSRYVR